MLRHSYFFIIYFYCSSLFAQTNEFLNFLSPNVNVIAGYNNSWWLPYITTKLDYHTEGYKIAYFDATISHALKWLPDYHINWQTNFNFEHQDEILRIQNTSTNLEQGYNKIISIINFGKEIDKYYDKELKKYVDGIEYQRFTLEYMKETFLITVKPNVNNLRYAAFYSENVYYFPQTISLRHYTKFQELRATFFSGHTSFLLYFIKALTNPAQSTEKDIIELGNKTETRFGFYFSTVNKPYEVTQIIGNTGTVSGEINTIYNAKFNNYGLVEEIHSKNLDMTTKFGIATIKLKKSLELTDSNNPIFFSLGLKFLLKIPISFTERMGMQINGSFEYQFLYGGTMVKDEETSKDKLVSQTFINADMLGKVDALFYYNF